MKKALFRRLAILGLVFTAASSFAVPAGGFDPNAPDYFTRNWADFFVWYLPNRLMDLSDIVTVQFGVGAAGSCQVNVTDFFQLGGAYGQSYEFGWAHRHQYGGGIFDAAQAGLFCGNYNTSEFYNPFGTFRDYVFSIYEFSCVDLDAMPYEEGTVDPWAVGARVGILFNADVKFHPLEVVDFVTGIFGYDLSTDDYWF